MGERYSVQAEGDGVAIAAAGELDLDAVGTLRDRLTDPHVRRVDLSAVTFIDSSAVSVLLDAHRAREAAGGLLLLRPSAEVRRVLHLAGVDRWLPTDDSGATRNGALADHDHGGRPSE